MTKNSSQDDKKIITDRVKAYHDLLELHSITDKLLYISHTPYNEAGRTSRYLTMKHFGNGVVSVLRTISRADDHAQIWSAAKSSRIIDKLLSPTPILTDSLLREVIIAYNGASSRQNWAEQRCAA